MKPLMSFLVKKKQYTPDMFKRVCVIEEENELQLSTSSPTKTEACLHVGSDHRRVCRGCGVTHRFLHAERRQQASDDAVRSTDEALGPHLSQTQQAQQQLRFKIAGRKAPHLGLIQSER